MRLFARQETENSAEKRGVEMSVIGTVTKVCRHKTDGGNLRLLVDVLTDNGYQTRLRYLQVRQPIPERGQHVSITGVPLDLKGRKPNTNIGAVRVSVL